MTLSSGNLANVSVHTHQETSQNGATPDSSSSPPALVLHPTVHPSLDITDPIHVLTSEGKSLHYHDPDAIASAIRSFASVHISGFIHPVVVLEHSASVISAKCDYETTTITVAFKDHSTWAMAVEDWKRHPQFLIVAFVDSCGLDRDPRERSVHIVKNIRISAPKLEIIGDMEDLALADAIHPDLVVTIDIDAFDLHNPAGPRPSAHIRRQDTNGSDPSERPPNNMAGSGSTDSDGVQSSSTKLSLLDLLKIDESDTDYIPSDQIEDDYWLSLLLPVSEDAIHETDMQSYRKRKNCIDRAGWGPFAILVSCVVDGIARLFLSDKQYAAYIDLSDFSAIGDKILTAAANYVATRLLENSPGGEVSFDTNKLLPMKNTEAFGLAYKVIEFTDNSIKDAKGNGLIGTIGLYCVNCRLRDTSSRVLVMNS
ncbi:hypothetical protein B0H11DRAFT_636248 [Mycena galericulata]|nr:hypothetical protein B0H11DRAFT_636248 [Mycena galericulata]